MKKSLTFFLIVCLLLFSCNSRKKRIETLQSKIGELEEKKIEFLRVKYLSGNKEAVYDADYSYDSLSLVIKELETEVKRLKNQGGINISIDY
jgi:hypothetical protein